VGVLGLHALAGDIRSTGFPSTAAGGPTLQRDTNTSRSLVLNIAGVGCLLWQFGRQKPFDLLKVATVELQLRS